METARTSPASHLCTWNSSGHRDRQPHHRHRFGPARRHRDPAPQLPLRQAPQRPQAGQLALGASHSPLSPSRVVAAWLGPSTISTSTTPSGAAAPIPPATGPTTHAPTANTSPPPKAPPQPTPSEKHPSTPTASSSAGGGADRPRPQFTGPNLCVSPMRTRDRVPESRLQAHRAQRGDRTPAPSAMRRSSPHRR